MASKKKIARISPRNFDSPNIIKKIALAIKNSRTIFIAGHERPDGDTAGASLALAHAINKVYGRAKKVSVYSKMPLPSYLDFLPGASGIKIGTPSTEKFDLAIILECSDLKRSGDIINSSQVKKIINIDHHAASGSFGDINYIDPHTSAVSCQIFYIIKYLKCPIDKIIAECIYTGILTDTGKLQQKNTTPEAFKIAAECLEKGRIDIALINEKVYASKSPAALRLLGAALSSLEIIEKKNLNGKKTTIAFITLTKDDFLRTGAAESDTEEIINYPLTIKDVDAVFFFRQINDNEKVKVSIRSKDAFDVLSLSTKYGGGGHKHAAGFSVSRSINEIKKEIIDSIGLA